jgi:hypothetical protein
VSPIPPCGTTDCQDNSSYEASKNFRGPKVRLFRLSPTRQRKALQVEERRKEGHFLAARAIHLILAHKPKRIDLAAIETKIIASIRDYLKGR